MITLTWTPQAKEDYWNNIDYLLEEFPIEVAERFVTKVEELEEQLKLQNVTYKSTSRKNVYQKPVVKQVTLFYYADQQKKVFLRFWNNKKDPRSLKF